MGYRARELAARLAQDYQIQIAYRSRRKLVSILQLFVRLVRLRPRLSYVFDISYSGVCAAACYKFIFRNCLIIETGDAIVELARSTGSRGPLGLWLTRVLESGAFKIADRIVVRGSFHKELLARQGIAAIVIQDGVDPDSFKGPGEPDLRLTEHLRRQHGLAGVLTIGLIGSSIWSEKLQMAYGWEVVETLRLLKDKPVKGIIVGSGSGIAQLKTRCREYGIEDKLVFPGQVPYEQLAGYLNLIDICLSTQTNDLVGQVRTTGKLPLYLAAGRYILASKVGEAAIVLPSEMLVEYEGVKDQEYPRKLKERIETILDHPEMLAAGAGNAALAKEYFDYALLAQRMKEVIGTTLAQQRAGEV